MAPVAAFALIQLQAVVAPLPSFPVIYANGFLFGTFWGGLPSWISVLVSAALCFGLARRWGRPLVERGVSPRRSARWMPSSRATGCSLCSWLGSCRSPRSTS